jgi:putative chitinase
VQGYAADIQIPSYGNPYLVARVLKRCHDMGKLEYDQLIFEFGSWVHISFDPRMRGQALTYKRGDKHARLGIIDD